MPLNELFEKSKETIKSMEIAQLVAIAGGPKRLKDNTETQKDLRDFLLKIEPGKLEEYSNDCINDSFENSGFVLQDIVNEIGRRLNFCVENGLYRGNINQVGYDGIWHLPNYDYVIEVKTTRATVLSELNSANPLYVCNAKTIPEKKVVSPTTGNEKYPISNI
mgnify:CR=1 FL=1